MRLLRFAIPIFALAQAPEPAGDLVLHIDVNLVQVDAVVYNHKGQPVTDLKPEDFEIFEDGKLQPITRFSYVRLSRAATPHVEAAPGGRPILAPVERLKREQVRRTVVLVVDDLNLSFESTAYVRRALRKFIETQMGPEDLVSIARTSTGLGALQNFTNDRRELYAALESIRWYPNGYAGIGIFPAVTPSVSPPGPANSAMQASGADLNPATGEAAMDERFQEEQRYLYASGTLHSLTSIIRGLREMPGRKGIILFSDGVSVVPNGPYQESIQRFLDSVADAANRSSVILNCVDARGLVYTGLGAADNPGDAAAAQGVSGIETTRRQTYITGQSGLLYLAAQTGGRAVLTSNDLNWAIDRVLDDLSGYYLLGYTPRTGTFHKPGETAQFHQIHVRVKRPGLELRSRKGFYGIPDPEARPKPVTDGDQLRAALQSSFGSNDIPVQVTCEYQSEGLNKGKLSGEIVTMIHVDARQITFDLGEDGLFHASLALLITGHDQDGRAVEQASNIIQIGVTEEQRKAARSAGLVFTQTVPVSRSGFAQVRAAVRDMPSGRIGSTSDFVLLPDLKKKRLAVTTLSVGQTGTVSTPDHAAVRVFHPGEPVPYRFSIFNPKVERNGRLSPRRNPGPLVPRRENGVVECSVR